MLSRVTWQQKQAVGAQNGQLGGGSGLSGDVNRFVGGGTGCGVGEMGFSDTERGFRVWWVT